MEFNKKLVWCILEMMNEDESQFVEAEHIRARYGDEFRIEDIVDHIELIEDTELIRAVDYACERLTFKGHVFLDRIQAARRKHADPEGDEEFWRDIDFAL